MDGILNAYHHIPVLTKEVTEYLGCAEGGLFVDATVGEGGHSRAILQSSEQTSVLAFDWDDSMLLHARKRLHSYRERIRFFHHNFDEIGPVLRDIGISQVDGLLFDLGISSRHLAEASRGFSFQLEGHLDMRMDRRKPLNGHRIVNSYPVRELISIIGQLGEERWAPRIAHAIERRRNQGPIETTTQLAEIVLNAIPGRYRPRTIHPATKTFQALRIAVNDELGTLRKAMADAPRLLRRGARVCVISFHSLEDRIVKDAFRASERGCSCPPDLPHCICGGNTHLVRVVTKKPVRPGPDEVLHNPRARSARLRVAERS